MQLAGRLKSELVIAGAENEDGSAGDLIDLWSPIVGPRQPFYSVEEVARLMRVSDCTVRAMIKDGRLEGRRFGGRVLVEASSIRLALERIEPSPQQGSE